MPSRPFLVTLASCLLVGAVLLTPRRRIETPPFMGLTRAHSVSPADSAVLEREVLARYEHRPLARLLGRRTQEPALANRIARAILRESRRLNVTPSLLTGVLLTENPQLETGTVSSQGAIGLMQVMRFHAGEYDCGSEDLREVETNICHGAQVFGDYLRKSGSVRRALLRYNGCVSSANTPNCYRYPAKVLRNARLVRRQLLLYPPYRFARDSGG